MSKASVLLAQVEATAALDRTQMVEAIKAKWPIVKTAKDAYKFFAMLKGQLKEIADLHGKQGTQVRIIRKDLVGDGAVIGPFHDLEQALYGLSSISQQNNFRQMIELVEVEIANNPKEG